MEYRPINLDDKLRKVTDHWSPKVIAKLNDYRFKLVKFKGEFVWHSHADTDEAFLVIDGTLTVYFRDGSVGHQRWGIICGPARGRAQDFRGAGVPRDVG